MLTNDDRDFFEQLNRTLAKEVAALTILNIDLLLILLLQAKRQFILLEGQIPHSSAVNALFA